MKNNILGIEGFLALQADSHSNPEVHEALQSANSRIKSMRVLYERLLSHEDAQEVSIRNYIENLIESILEVFPLPKPITIQQELGDFYLHAKKATNLGIILNELITNTFKHAFPAIEKGIIRIILKKSGSTASLVVEDNGVGIDEGSLDTKAPSFGLTIVKMLADQLSGKLEIRSNSGTRVRLEFEV